MALRSLLIKGAIAGALAVGSLGITAVAAHASGDCTQYGVFHEIAKDFDPISGSGSYFWLIAVGVRAGNGVGGPPGTQDGTRGATGPRAGSRAATSDACEARVPAPGDRATLPSRDMSQSPFRG